MSIVYCPSKVDGSTVSLSTNERSDRGGESAKKRGATEAERTKETMYADAERRMLRGKRLVISGFVVAVLGMIAYCLACFAAGMNANLGAALIENPGWLIGPAMAIMGVGALLWLVGSFLYLLGGMDSDPEGPDLYF
jgi:hypothetical protein